MEGDFVAPLFCGNPKWPLKSCSWVFILSRTRLSRGYFRMLQKVQCLGRSPCVCRNLTSVHPVMLGHFELVAITLKDCIHRTFFLLCFVFFNLLLPSLKFLISHLSSFRLTHFLQNPLYLSCSSCVLHLCSVERAVSMTSGLLNERALTWPL